jgi:hypothetical protein
MNQRTNLSQFYNTEWNILFGSIGRWNAAVQTRPCDILYSCGCREAGEVAGSPIWATLPPDGLFALARLELPTALPAQMIPPPTCSPAASSVPVQASPGLRHLGIFFSVSYSLSCFFLAWTYVSHSLELVISIIMYFPCDGISCVIKDRYMLHGREFLAEKIVLSVGR